MDKFHAGGISNFFSQLIVSFGYTDEQSLLVGVPGGLVEVIALVGAGILGDKLRNRLVRAQRRACVCGPVRLIFTAYSLSAPPGWSLLSSACSLSPAWIIVIA